MAQLILLVAMLVLLWALLIRPQRSRQRRQQELLSSVEPGDEILTVGGIYGIVQEVDDEDDLVVEIADGIHVRVARRAVAGVVKAEDEDDELDEGEEAEEADERLEGGESEFVKEEGAESPAALERR